MEIDAERIVVRAQVEMDCTSIAEHYAAVVAVIDNFCACANLFHANEDFGVFDPDDGHVIPY